MKSTGNTRKTLSGVGESIVKSTRNTGKTLSEVGEIGILPVGAFSQYEMYKYTGCDTFTGANTVDLIRRPMHTAYIVSFETVAK